MHFKGRCGIYKMLLYKMLKIYYSHAMSLPDVITNEKCGAIYFKFICFDETKTVFSMVLKCCCNKSVKPNPLFHLIDLYEADSFIA